MFQDILALYGTLSCNLVYNTNLVYHQHLQKEYAYSEIYFRYKKNVIH